MYSFSLNRESRTWWAPSAAAGMVSAAAIAAILAIPTTGHAIPVDDTPAPAPALSPVEDPGVGTRPCFMIQPPRRWNTALDGDQPTCGIADQPARVWTFVIRPGLDTGV
jgi:hypothetical protein